MTERQEDRSPFDQPDRSSSFGDWEISLVRARERTDALRSRVSDVVTDGEASQAAYNELALAYEELTVAHEELRGLNEQLADASARIEQEGRRYQELFLAAPVPYIVTDVHGSVVEANDGASRLLHVTRARLRGKPLVVFVSDLSRRRLRRAILERRASPGTSSVRLKLTPRKSPPIFAEATLSSVADTDGTVREIRWLVVDRTRAALESRARRSRADELNALVAERTAELETAQRLKDRLVATVSHEFRTGLAAIGGYAELLELGIHGSLSDVQRSDIGRIRKAYEHLALVVEDLLSYGKIVAGKLSVELVDLELGDAIRGLAELLAPQSKDRNVLLRLESSGDEVVVRADAERLRQILLNVVGNAIKFSPRNSTIVVRWQGGIESAFVEVIDDGPGVPEEAREAVFEPFNRLENSSSVPGTGLGLPISRELARAMGGDLTAEHNPAGHGGRFVLRLSRSMRLAAGGGADRQGDVRRLHAADPVRRKAMQCRNIVVIGASAGGIEALQRIVRELPADLDASLFVTVHFPEGSASLLPQVLGRKGRLPTSHPADGERIVTRRIYVAPPDYHLLIEHGAMRLVRGARENGHRPAIDPMFRSAAVAFGPRVIGVILSGNLDDGVSGLAAVKRRGGVALVQDPADAAFDSMPRSAIAHTRVDRIATAAELGKVIVEYVQTPVDERELRPMTDDTREVAYAAVRLDTIESPEEHPGTVSPFSCPDCGGVLWQIREGDIVRFRCRVGHGWTMDALLTEQADQVDDALWAALRALEERASLLWQMSARYRRHGSDALGARFQRQSEQMEARAHLVRDLLVRHRGVESEEQLKSG